MFVAGSTDKPELDNDLLMHFGIKGMKWGVRRGSSKTGVSRARGALIDRNQRHIKRTKDLLAGKGLLRDRVEYRMSRISVGKSMTDRLMKVGIKEMNDQNHRLKSGKVTFHDKLAVFGHANVANMLISNTPKKK